MSARLLVELTPADGALARDGADVAAAGQGPQPPDSPSELEVERARGELSGAAREARIARLRSSLAALAVVLAVTSADGAASKDLGVRGETFPIIETDILEMLRNKFSKLAKSGKIDALNKAFAARVEKRVERPVPVAGVATTRQPRSWMVDPSIVVPRDYADHRGRIFARKGDRLNPLERIPGFDQTMVFINGDDPAQVKFGLSKLAALGPEKVSVILTDGAPLQLMRKHKAQFFFDQEGRLTRHYALTQVPAVVEVDPKNRLRLRVSEVRP